MHLVVVLRLCFMPTHFANLINFSIFSFHLFCAFWYTVILRVSSRKTSQTFFPGGAFLYSGCKPFAFELAFRSFSLFYCMCLLAWANPFLHQGSSACVLARGSGALAARPLVEVPYRLLAGGPCFVVLLPCHRRSFSGAIQKASCKYQ